LSDEQLDAGAEDAGRTEAKPEKAAKAEPEAQPRARSKPARFMDGVNSILEKRLAERDAEEKPEPKSRKAKVTKPAAVKAVKTDESEAVTEPGDEDEDEEADSGEEEGKVDKVESKDDDQDEKPRKTGSARNKERAARFEAEKQAALQQAYQAQLDAQDAQLELELLKRQVEEARQQRDRHAALLREAGLGGDERDVEIENLRAQLGQQKHAEEIEQMRAQQRYEFDRNQLGTTIAAEARAVAEETGLNAGELVRWWATETMRNGGQPVDIRSLATERAEYEQFKKNRGAAQVRVIEQEKNRNAPRPIRPGSRSAGGSFTDMRDGVSAMLSSSRS
jgi:antitoxin component of RelBE/YafQ-DinJ toxin-antitoxin module